jgi:hypothetical protein
MPVLPLAAGLLDKSQYGSGRPYEKLDRSFHDFILSKSKFVLKFHISYVLFMQPSQ